MPLFLILVCLLVPAAALAQQDKGRKEARAVRVPAGSIQLDGRLDETTWRDVPPLTDFIQKEPVEGAQPTERMEVRFAYDDDALYVGARMYSSSPVQAPMGRRDSSDQAEHVVVSLDTYLDRRTASSFGVTASGVRIDRYYASDNDFNSDDGFDPVWQARTTMETDGWSAELWIPFSQLRFNERSPQVWGLNVQRWVPSRNEEVFWEMVARTDEGWASRFGDLHGIDGIRPSRRLELLPYVAGASQLFGVRDARDPFTSGGNLEGRAGLDMKVGLGSNLTLEATVNPDFGQVEADPAEVNLSAFETFFDERRPFFVEGSDLLTGNVNNYFYSRRIGAAPSGRAAGDFVDYPATTTILGAAKLTGRLASGTSVGMLGAVTAEEFARTFSASTQFGQVRVAPSTTYGVARVEQEFGPPGSTAGFMATAVHRSLDPRDPLASLLTRSAFTLSGDSVVRLKDGEYELQADLGLGYVNGDAGAIQRLQRSSARYFQRPDVTYVRFDPLRTSMGGVKGNVSLERRNGRHWLWEASTSFETPEFETNDLGRLTSADGITSSGEIEYRETVPGRWYRDYTFTVSPNAEWNTAGDRQSASIDADATFTWLNFWETDIGGTLNFRSQDMRLTRGGPSMQQPQGWQANIEVESSDASRTRGDASLTYGRDEDGGLVFEVGGGVTFQPGSRWELSLNPGYEREVGTQQYVSTLSDGRPETFGSRYVFAHIDRSTYSTEVRLNYTFKPDLNLDFYAEPFAASGRYSSFGELAAPRGRLLLPIGPDGPAIGDRDFNVQSLRSNLVLRWEWRPGSTLYLVWQQDRAAEEMIGRRATLGDMFGSVGASGDNFFAVKMTYWFSPN